MMPKRSVLMGLAIVLALTACGERGPTESENEFPRMRGS
jgi:predicted small lipoprotein YifL